ncbi:MAG TPA: LysR family transcriptional regulator [Clostridiales bacterium]|jgi:DNA-binding transcriptional LysR family regulator|nr:LysR family transcriptional regulator [Clostridiales bacterium]
MDIRYLEDFALLAEIKNYAETADELNISSSTLTRHIKAIEDELGVELFTRTTRKVELNPFGHIFLEYARQIVELYRQGVQDLRKAQKSRETTVQLATNYYIDDLLAAFYDYDKNVTVNPVILENIPEFASHMSILRLLNNYELALVVDLPENEKEEMATTVVSTDRYVAVVSKNHPLASKKSVALKELAREDFVSFHSGSYGDLRLHCLCRQAGFEPKIKARPGANVGSAIATLVSHGLGISILFKKSVSKTTNAEITFVDIEPAITAELALCHRKNVRLTDGAKRLKQFIINEWIPSQTGNGGNSAPQI